MPAEANASRRVLGFVMAGSSALMLLVAALVYSQAIPVSEQSRMLVAGILGFTAVLDMLIGVYFILSDPS